MGSGEGVRMFASIVDGSVVGVTYQKTVATVENIVHDRMKVQQQGFLHNSSQRRSDPHIVLGIDTGRLVLRPVLRLAVDLPLPLTLTPTPCRP
jgi:hypothetical protein